MTPGSQEVNNAANEGINSQNAPKKESFLKKAKRFWRKVTRKN